MRATIMHAAGDVQIENVPDATLIEPTDALLRVSRACICGSDLWPYRSMQRTDHGQRMGHEAIGVVEAIGANVHTVKRGDVVVMPFAISDGTCGRHADRVALAREFGAGRCNSRELISTSTSSSLGASATASTVTAYL